MLGLLSEVVVLQQEPVACVEAVLEGVAHLTHLAHHTEVHHPHLALHTHLLCQPLHLVARAHIWQT